MRFSFPALVAVCASLAACNQDSAASNEQRDTHLGDVRAVDRPSAFADAATVVLPAGSAGPTAAPATAPPPAAAPMDH